MMRIRRDAFLWTKEDITEGMETWSVSILHLT